MDNHYVMDCPWPTNGDRHLQVGKGASFSKNNAYDILARFNRSHFYLFSGQTSLRVYCILSDIPEYCLAESHEQTMQIMRDYSGPYIHSWNFGSELRIAGLNLIQCRKSN